MTPQGLLVLTLTMILAGCQGGSERAGDSAMLLEQTDNEARSAAPAQTPTANPGPSGQPAISAPDPSSAAAPADPAPANSPSAEAPTEPPAEAPVAQDPAPEDNSSANVYSTLEGYGTSSTFGLGGDVCTVSSLADDGSGTLRSCIEDRRSDDIPLEVRFAVGGTITLESTLQLDSPFLTIDGSTAPAPGITIQTGEAKFLGIIAQTNLNRAHDVLISHLRIRGSWDRRDMTDVEGDRTIGVDCENNDTGAESVNLNVVLNRLSLLNSPDGGPDFWGACRGITLQRTFLYHNVHPITVSAGSASQLRARISIHRNVFWNNPERNPQIRGNVEDLDYVNNVIGGWQWYGVRIRGNSASDYPKRINLLSNVWLGDGSGRDATALELLNMPNTDGIFDDDNQYPLTESDRGTASNQFSSDAEVTRYPVAQLEEVLIGPATNYKVGTHYPTSEEANLLETIRGRL